MKKITKTIIYISLILIIDFFISNLFLKNKNFWKYDKLLNHYWRVPSNIYHHGLLPNINVIEPWGFSLKKRLITNSLAFRDFSSKDIKKKSNKKRLLLIGDSAIEGAGYDYEFTIGGLLQNYLINDYEVLNSAVGSYSPSIYYKKIQHFINQGYIFDRAIIFLDPSDIIDELFINWDNDNNIIVNEDAKKKISFSEFLVNNFLIFRSILRISDSVENLKNFFKLKYKASKKFNKSLFETTNEDTLFYRMTHVDRSAWTFDNTLFKNYEEGLVKSEKYLNKLIKILRKNKIDVNFVLYPHPSQIIYKDLYHHPYWENWTTKNNINFITLYPDFDGQDKRKIVLDTFIFGDLHWNKNGTKIIFNSLINKINF
tara:strand:- start:403 stop:1512 length:1110 start_codon:yes stop_codon:yes gene_type:complete